MCPDFGAVIFDLDGLVLDTETTYFAAWRQAAGKMGYQLSEPFCKSLSGLSYGAVTQKIFDLCGPDFDLERFNRISGDCWRTLVQTQGIEVKPGFHQLLELIRRQTLPYCLATNSRLTNALACLDLAGLTNIFEVIVARDHVEYGKPAPDIFWVASERLGIDISRCLALEDSAAGVIGATEAGAFSIFIPSSLPADDEATFRCDRQCPDLNEVARWLQGNLAY